VLPAADAQYTASWFAARLIAGRYRVFSVQCSLVTERFDAASVSPAEPPNRCARTSTCSSRGPGLVVTFEGAPPAISSSSDPLPASSRSLGGVAPLGSTTGKPDAARAQRGGRVTSSIERGRFEVSVPVENARCPQALYSVAEAVSSRWRTRSV
jgi:hypothetical protein